MNNGREFQLSEDVLKTLKGKNSLFLYTEKMEIPASPQDLILCQWDFFNGAMIHMYWDRPACLITPSFGQKIIPLGISRNLTNTMIKLERLIGGKDHCIVLDSLEELARGVGRDPCSRFLSILLRRSREQNRTVLSFFKAGPFNYDPEHYLFRSFDNIFNVDKNGISEHSSNNLPQQKDPWQFNTAPAGSDTGTEMEKIKDIFRLTPEEQKELDEIVGERVREFSIS